MIGKHPACVMELEVGFSAVDVNVHPAKLEVRFTNEKPVFDAVYWGTKTALSEKDERKEIKLPERKPVSTQTSFAAPASNAQQITTFEKIKKEAPKSVSAVVLSQNEPALNVRDSGADVIQSRTEPVHIQMPVIPPVKKSVNVDIFPSFEEKIEKERIYTVAAAKSSEETGEKTEETSFELPDYKIIGEAFDTYIIIQTGKQLILIDKHAAHERLIFKRLMEARGEPDSQMLLTPVTVTLEKTQCGMVMENTDLLARAGFEVEDFGMGTVIVRAVPTSLADTDIAGAIMEIAGNLGSKADATLTAKTERMYQTIACKAAIKAGDISKPQELAELVLTLVANPDVRYCPHGRPIWITLKKSEIESNFGRA